MEYSISIQGYFLKLHFQPASFILFLLKVGKRETWQKSFKKIILRNLVKNWSLQIIPAFIEGLFAAFKL